MKITVIGAGIGGLTTAIALQQRGHEVTVFESATQLASAGKGIWVPTNALLVLDRLGLGEAIANRGIVLDRIEVHDTNQGLLQELDLLPLQEEFGRRTLSILRSELQEELISTLEDGSLHLGKRCRLVESIDSEVHVLFEDDTQITSDLVVGADGIHSVVRESVTPKTAPRSSGQTCSLGISNFQMPRGLLNTAREVWGGADRFGFSAVGSNQVYWYAPTTRAQVPKLTPDDHLATLQSRYSLFPEPIPQLLEDTPMSSLVQVDLQDFDPLQQWHRDRIVLVGDAAHAMTPNLGQGGAQAIEDGLVLAQVLTNEQSLENALFAFERFRRRKATRLVKRARWLGRVAHWQHPWARTSRNLLMRSAPRQLGLNQLRALYTLNY